MFVAGRQRMQSRVVADQQLPTFRDHSNPCYRQISQLLTNGPQPATMSWPDREEQFVIVAAAERQSQRILTLPLLGLANLGRDWNRGCLQRDSDARGFGNLPDAIRQAVAHVHATRGRTITAE